MATLLVTPLFHLGIDDVNKDAIQQKLFGPTVETPSIASTVIQNGGNGVVFTFDSESGALSAKESIDTRFAGMTPGLITKVRVTQEVTPVMTRPVFHTDPRVPQGLLVFPEWISLAEEMVLIAEIDALEWDTRIKRRVQHYGYTFQYSRLNVDDSKPPTSFPHLCGKLLERDELKGGEYNQLTINEYIPGIGIASHCDTHSAFSDTIAVVSICGSTCVEYVSHDERERVSVVIPRRSLYLMSGDSRYGWRHAIAARKTDVDPLSGQVVPRDPRRVSLTFRKCITYACTCEFKNLCDSQGADVARPRRLQEG
jgi:alkylated DNA repair dioxygenase AlkB